MESGSERRVNAASLLTSTLCTCLLFSVHKAKGFLIPTVGPEVRHRLGGGLLVAPRCNRRFSYSAVEMPTSGSEASFFKRTNRSSYRWRRKDRDCLNDDFCMIDSNFLHHRGGSLELDVRGSAVSQRQLLTRPKRARSVACKAQRRSGDDSNALLLRMEFEGVTVEKLRHWIRRYPFGTTLPVQPFSLVETEAGLDVFFRKKPTLERSSLDGGLSLVVEDVVSRGPDGDVTRPMLTLRRISEGQEVRKGYCRTPNTKRERFAKIAPRCPLPSLFLSLDSSPRHSVGAGYVRDSVLFRSTDEPICNPFDAPLSAREGAMDRSRAPGVGSAMKEKLNRWGRWVEPGGVEATNGDASDVLRRRVSSIQVLPRDDTVA